MGLAQGNGHADGRAKQKATGTMDKKAACVEQAA
jgi:hypothetical protein